MSEVTKLHIYKQHLQDRYTHLIEKSNNYRFVDESKSDNAAFKAMKILSKINKLAYLDRDVLNAIS
jgi:hypothetical protein